MKRHYLALDGLRGIAAIIVMFYHRQYWSHDGLPFEHAGLAVDFFFMLSGFVMSLAYERKINAGMAFLHFAAIRLARLGPMLLLGTLLGIIYYGILAAKHKYHFGLTEGLAMLLSLFALPTPFPTAFFPATAFPVNGPAWSLFFELIANAIFALVLPRLRGLVLIALVMLPFVWLAFGVGEHGSVQNFGNAYGQTWLGLPRVLFPFFIGVILHRLEAKSRLPHIPGGFWLAGAFLVGSFMLAVPPEYKGWYELTCVALVCPAVIVLGASARLSSSTGRLAAWLGRISYPVYILHIPLLNWYESISGVHSLSSLVLAGGLIILASQLAIGVWDNPIRRRLDIRIRDKWAPSN